MSSFPGLQISDILTLVSEGFALDVLNMLLLKEIRGKRTADGRTP